MFIGPLFFLDIRSDTKDVLLQTPGQFALKVMPKIMAVILVVSGIGTAYLLWAMF